MGRLRAIIAWWQARRAEVRDRRREDRARRKDARAGRQGKGLETFQNLSAGHAPATLRVPRAAALKAIAALVLASAGVSFAESYRGLYLWAHHHGLSGPWAALWPLQVDVFIAVGELALFVALVDGWKGRHRLAAWAVTCAGLGVSVSGNIGHVTSHALTSRATAAVPPLAAAAALAVGLGVLKRVVQAHHPAVPGPESVPGGAPGPHPVPGVTPDDGAGLGALVAWLTSDPAAVPAVPEAPAGLNGHASAAAEMFAADLHAGRVPGIRAIRSGLHVGQDKAQEVQAYLKNLSRTRS